MRCKRMKKQIRFEVLINTVPECLRYPLPADKKYLSDTACLYHLCVNSRLLWKVCLIDEYGKLWIAIHRMEESGVHFHTLAIDEGTYEKIETDEPYDVLVEAPHDT